ncbi:MAG: hypothetical protein U0Y68_02485 [Blastocatellia bacterium]
MWITQTDYALTVAAAPSCGFAALSAQPGVQGAGRQQHGQSDYGGQLPWTASATASWIELQTSTGSGAGTLSFTVAPNTTPLFANTDILLADRSDYDHAGRRGWQL